MEVSIKDPTLARDLADLEAAGSQLSWLARRRMEQELAIYGLTPPQYMALSCLRARQPGCSMSELAEASYQVSATMTGIVDRLVEGGLARRERHPTDRRALQVTLTDKGVELLEQISRRKRAWLAQFFGYLSAEERREILDAAQRYLSFLEHSMND